MKVYLINPPAPNGVKMVREGRCMQRKGAWGAVWAPISLAIIGAQLKKNSHHVILSDCITENISFSVLKKMISEFVPDLIIINTATPSIETDLYTATIAKDTCVRVVTAAIGIHVTALPDQCFSMQPNLDIIVHGEPEITVSETANALGTNGSLDAVEGISYRNAGKIKHNPPRNPIENIDTLPFPDWGLIKREHHIMPLKNKPFLLIATSRGCPYPCVFCADSVYYGKKLRIMSPKRIVDEIVWNKQKYGISDFLFWAEGFTLDKEAARAVAEEIIKRNVSCQWVCNSRVDMVDQELLRIFKKAGCWMIGYGIESGNDKILKKIKKNVTVQQIRKTILITHEAGLMVTGHFVIGFPEETKEDILSTVQLALSSPIDFAQFYCAVPFPGSDLYDSALRNNWIVNMDWKYFEQNYSVMNTQHLSAQEIMRLRKFAYRKFYFNLPRIINTLKNINSIGSMKLFVTMLKEFFKWI